MKKLLAFLLCLVMVIAVCACSGGTTTETTATPTAPAGDDKPLAGTYDITIWCAENAVNLFKSQVEKFNTTNTDGITFNATVEPVGEGEAATKMITDVEAGGDIFCFAQDQFARLVQANAVNKLGENAQKTVKDANDAGVVAAATSGDTMYAYPMTSDNGYFMYYDKSVIPETAVDSLEDIIAACEAAGKYFAFGVEGSAWYTASFFFATGCYSDWTTDDDGKFISVSDNYNSDAGLISAKGLKKLVSSDMYLDASTGNSFDNGAAVVVTGTWDYVTVSEILGDNMGVTDLPSFTVDGKSYHLGSFNGCKLMGVKPQKDAKKQAAIHKLAQYLTGYDCQMERFDELAWGPSNLQAQASDKVKANPGLAALFKQNEYSKPQGNIHGSWWDIAKVIATEVKEAKDDAGLKAALQNYDDKIHEVFNVTDDVANAYTVIGNINGDGWSVDLEMTKNGNVWRTTEAYPMDETTEFKVRKGKTWNNGERPDDNFKVDKAGTYYVVYDTEKDEVRIIEKDSFTVIGAINGDSWTIDLPMTLENGVWKTTVAYEMAAGVEFKVRQAEDWSVNYPADNFKVDAAGTYFVQFDTATHEVSIVAG